MVTGKRAFEGTSAASLITAIMGAEPPALATLQPLTPGIAGSKVLNLRDRRQEPASLGGILVIMKGPQHRVG